MEKTTLLALMFFVLTGLCLAKPSSHNSRNKIHHPYPLKRGYKNHPHALYVRELASKYKEKRFEDCIDKNPYECMYQMFVEPADCDVNNCAFSCHAC